MKTNMDENLAKKIDDFFIQYKHQVYKKGEILIRADEQPSGIFYLKSGIVKVYAISKKGDELVLNIFKPVSFFPMNWAINDSHNLYFYEAVTDVEVWKSPKEKVSEFIKSNPEVLYNLLSRLYKGMDGLLRRMYYFMNGSAYERLVCEILIYSKRFGNKFLPEDLEAKEIHTQNTVKIHITEKELGTSAGLTRETVSREMKILKDKGLVFFVKNVLVILDIEKLEEELNNN